MTKYYLIILISIVLFSCGIKDNEISLKIGPVNISENSKLNFVYGVKTSSPDSNYITEFHYNLQGKPNCNSKEIKINFKFNNLSKILLKDSINNVSKSSSFLVQRSQKENNIEVQYKNQPIGLGLFNIEKFNISPNGLPHKGSVNVSTKCNSIMEIPFEIVKYKSKDINLLIDRYVQNILDKQTVNNLKSLIVCFSFNKVINRSNFNIDLVDQRTMLILTFDRETNEYVISNNESTEVKRKKRST